MLAPRVPNNVYDERGRHDNIRNPLIARVWRSSMPSCAWFTTINISDTAILQAVFDELLVYFPDATYVLCAVCSQDIYHIHALIATCNEYSRTKADSNTRTAITRALTRHPGCRASLANITAVYRGVTAATKYIDSQRIDSRVLSYGDPMKMGRYGNVWDREYTGKRGSGVDYYEVRDWCMNGFPPYCVDVSTKFRGQAMQCFMRYNRAFSGRRGHISRNVRFYEFAGGDAEEPFRACKQALSSCFGVNTAASIPFVHDIRGILGAFINTAPPLYAGQPGIILYVSSDYQQRQAENDTVRAIRARTLVYYNVEVLCVIKL